MQIYDYDTVAANNDGAPPDGAPEFMPYAEVNDTIREVMASIARWRVASQAATITTGGTSTAYTLTSGQSLTALADGMTFAFRPHVANGTSPTINIDGTGALAIRTTDGSTLEAGVLTANLPVTITRAGGTFYLVSAHSNNRATGPSWQLTQADDGAAAGPLLVLDRNSASPAASDAIARLDFQGRDSAGGGVRYAAVEGIILDPTNGSEDGALVLVCRVADTPTSVMTLASGVTIGNPAGGHQGVGTLNLDGPLYRDGVQVVTTQGALIASVTGTADASYGANEVTLINDLTTAVNAILARLRAHGLIAT